MATVSDIIKSSLRLLGVLAQGETPSSQESADALVSLNDMIDSWSNDGFLVFNRVIESFTMGTASSYTLGSGGDFSTTRPIRLIEASFKQGGSNAEIPIRIFTSQEWLKITDKTVTSSLPKGIYYNDNFPLGVIYPYPILSASGTLILHSDKQIVSFSAISDTVSLPPGYSRALRYNLAVELASEYGKSISQELGVVALESKNLIMQTNVEPVLMTSDIMGLGQNRTFDYRRGY